MAMDPTDPNYRDEPDEPCPTGKRWNRQLQRCIVGSPSNQVGAGPAERDPGSMPCGEGQCKDTVTGQCRSFNPKREKVNMTDTWERSAGPDWAGREATSGGRGYCRKLDPKPEAAPVAAPASGGGAVTTGGGAGGPSSTLAYTGNPLMDAMAELFNSRAGIFGTKNPFLSSATSRAPGTIPTTASTVGPSGEIIPPKDQELEGMFLPGGGLWWGAQGDLTSALAPFASMFSPGGDGHASTQLPLPAGPGGGGVSGGNPAAPAPLNCVPGVMYKVGHPCATVAGGGSAPGGTIPPGGCNPRVMYKVGHPCANQGIFAGTTPTSGGGPLQNALVGQGLTF